MKSTAEKKVCPKGKHSPEMQLEIKCKNFPWKISFEECGSFISTLVSKAWEKQKHLVSAYPI